MIQLSEKLSTGYLNAELIGMAAFHLVKYKTHRRLRVFYEKGCKCVYCDAFGIYLINARDKGGNWHVDLYTRNLELMTIDHIVAKSKGGKNNIENLQPCCASCNLKKGNLSAEEFEKASNIIPGIPHSQITIPKEASSM